MRGLQLTFELIKALNISYIENTFDSSNININELIDISFSFSVNTSESIKLLLHSYNDPICPYKDFNDIMIGNFIDQAYYAYTWSISEQAIWNTLLPIALERLNRFQNGVDVVYFSFVYQAALNTVNMEVLQKIESHGQKLVDHYLDTTEQINIHPFATLSWGFLSLNSIQRISGLVSDHFMSQCIKPYAWSPMTFKSNSRIRIGYLSQHFRIIHPIGDLMQSIFKYHNRSKFEVYCFSLKKPTNSSLEIIFREVCEHFLPVYDTENGSKEIIEAIKSNNIQILVDLDGFMELRQNRLLALYFFTLFHSITIRCSNPAPISVNYLGFPGTMSSSFTRFMIVDRITVPKKFSEFYNELLIYMPNSYFPTSYKDVYFYEVKSTEHLHLNIMKNLLNQDSTINSADLLYNLRLEFDLPTDKFLFACFNAMNKIGPYFLSAAVEILKKSPHSVLVLLSPNLESIKENIWNYSSKFGILQDRIIFLPRISLSKHLRRLAAFDLMLDTFPYNSHTTTGNFDYLFLNYYLADSLWAGLPVLTFPQSRMAGRVAASQLYATGCLNKLLHPSRVDSLIEGDNSIGHLKQLYTTYENRKYDFLSKISASSSLPIFESDVKTTTTNLLYTLPRLTNLGGNIFLKKSQETYQFKSQFEIKDLPPHVVPFDLSSENPFGSLVAETKDVYVDLAVFFSYSTKSRMEWRSCIENSRWNSPLFNSVKYTEDLESGFTNLWENWYNSESKSFSITTSSSIISSISHKVMNLIFLDILSHSNECFTLIDTIALLPPLIINFLNIYLKSDDYSVYLKLCVASITNYEFKSLANEFRDSIVSKLKYNSIHLIISQEKRNELADDYILLFPLLAIVDKNFKLPSIDLAIWSFENAIKPNGNLTFAFPTANVESPKFISQSIIDSKFNQLPDEKIAKILQLPNNIVIFCKSHN